MDILRLLGILLVIAGVYFLITGGLLYGIVLIIIGLVIAGGVLGRL